MDLEYSGGTQPSSSYPTYSSSGSEGTPPLQNYVVTATDVLRNYVLSYYDHVEHIDTSKYNDTFFSNDINASNPYEKSVTIDGSYFNYFAVDILKASGNIVVASNPHKNVLGDKVYDYTIYNNAYTEFEAAATKAQTSAANEEIINYLSNAQSNINSFSATMDKNYSRSVFGSESISDATQHIGALQYEIEQLTIQDTLSQFYNRIDDTNNSQRIAELQTQLAQESNSLEVLKNSYEQEEREFIRDITKESSEGGLGGSRGDFWKLGFTPMYEPPMPDDYDYTATARQDIKSFMTLNTTEEMNRWMAGGDLYDAPRAGDVAFSVVGNLNTVRFLGIEDTNKTADMLLAHINPELQQMFGELAGEDNFNIF